MSVRDFPFPNHGPARWRWCKWCGLEIVGEKGHYWHAACVTEMELHTRRDKQLLAIIERDGKCCGQCGDSPEKWLRGEARSCTIPPRWQPKAEWAKQLWTLTEIGRLPRCFDPQTGRSDPEHLDVWMLRGGQCPIERASALELDHRVPLWKVAHIPPAERRQFFGPYNLWLLCPTCHTAKTKAEAAERAAWNRQRCGILIPRLEEGMIILRASLTSCLCPAGHSGPHRFHFRGRTIEWERPDDCGCCEPDDPDRCFDWEYVS